MKIPALLTALALASGVAFAQSGDSAAGPNTNDKAASAQMDKGSSTASASMHRAGESVADKVKRGAHKVADATRRAGHKLSAKMHRKDDNDSARHASNNHTRSMGAAPSDDSGRRSRMDQAYESWKAKHTK